MNGRRMVNRRVVVCGCRQAAAKAWLVLAVFTLSASGVGASRADDLPDSSPSSITATVPPWPAGPFVILRNGGVLAGQLMRLTHDMIEIESVTWGRLRFASAAISGYRQTAGDRPWKSTSNPQAAPIWLMLANGDQVAADSLVVSAGQCEIQLLSPPAGDRLVLPLTRVQAIDFLDATHHGFISEPALGQTVLWVAFQDGSRFPVHAQPGRGSRGGMPSRAVVMLEPVSLPPLKTLLCPADELVSQMPQEAGQWLACRQPARVTQALTKDLAAGGVPLLSLPDEERVIAGATWAGGWPRLRGLTGFSAIAIHSPCCAEYVFERPVKRLAAVVGIDDSAGQRGSVILRVTVASRRAAGGEAGLLETVAAADEDRERLQEVEVFRSGLVRGGEPPLQLDLEFGPARCLRLYVEPAGAGQVLDRTLWLDPRVEFLPADLATPSQE